MRSGIGANEMRLQLVRLTNTYARCLRLDPERYAYIFYDVECDRSDFARLYSVPVLNRSPPSVSSRWFFVNKPVSCIYLPSTHPPSDPG